MKKSILLLISIVVLCPALHLQAQSPAEGDNPSLTRTIPPPPTAASLGRYGDVPVGMYTGIPGISIPLTEARSGSLSVPISLSYNAGGIRVEEIASWVGLGWALNSGGVITRTVRGRVDEKSTFVGTFKDNIDYLNDPTKTASQKWSLWSDLAAGRADSEPDLYFFNFGGESGKFVLEGDLSVGYVLPQRKIKIEPTRSANEFIRWVITTEDGTRYIFGKSTDGTRDGIEYNETYSVCIDKNDPAPTTPIPDPTRIAQSWYLVEAISPNGDIITFDYTAYQYAYRTHSNETDYFLKMPFTAGEAECRMKLNYCFQRNLVDGKRLRRINFKNGKIEFDTRPGYRADMCGDKALDVIKVFEGNSSTPVKSFRFDYSYFTPPNQNVPEDFPTGCYDITASDANAKYRLKLVAVAEVGSDNVPKPPHAFTYVEKDHLGVQYNFPPRIDYPIGTNTGTYAQDHWGFFNGAMNNNHYGFPTLIPAFSYDMGDGTIVVVPGANRAVNPAYAAAYSLKKIKYPTGGFTEFDMESNTVTSDQLPVEAGLDNGVSKTRALCLVSASNENTKTAVSDPIVINSEFTLNGVKGALVRFSWFETATPGDGVCSRTDPAVNRYFGTNPNSTSYQNYPSGHEQFFPNGTYYLKLAKKSDYACYSSFCTDVRWTEFGVNNPPSGDPVNVLVGGLRIAKMTHNDGMDPAKNQVTYYNYGKFDNPQLTSGVLSNYLFKTFPKYGGNTYREDYISAIIMGGQHCVNKFYSCSFLVKESYSTYPLATTQGAIAGYQNVTVLYGEDGANGKKEFTYTTAKLYPDEMVPVFPNAPPCSFDWRRGLLLKETTYKKVNTTFTAVAEVENEYFFSIRDVYPDPLTVAIKGLKVGVSGMSYDRSCQGSSAPVPTIAYWEYNTKSEHHYLKSIITRTMDSTDPSKISVVTQNFEHSPIHLQPTKITTTSNSGERVEYRKYPLDFTGLSASPNTHTKGVKLLQDKHIISPVIESYKTDKTATSEVVVGGEINTYRENPSNPAQVVPYQILQLQLASSLPLTGTGAFVPSKVTSGNITWYSGYTSRISSEFNAEGNLSQTEFIHDVPQAYQWGYGNTLPIAEVKNAKNQPGLLEFLYINFEDHANGSGIVENQSAAHTGRKYYNGTTVSGSPNFTVSFTLPNARSYVIEYWYFNTPTGKWEHVSKPYAGSSMTLTESKIIDNIRIYPADAMMTSYTYDPLRGMTSVIDENGRVMKYEYDSLGRLSGIRNENGQMEKEYSYNYRAE